jgi:arsenite methyltransferase
MQDTIKDAVRDNYGQLARGSDALDAATIAAVAQAFGYSAEELASLPGKANLGVSCGNPVAMASLAPGEVVVDLGSGGGMDVFLAAKAVGPAGRAIGIDMTGDMIALARRNAESGGYANAEFHQAPIEAMPLAAGTADCVISNCVINLVPDKDAAYAEIFRILKPGGRLAISDIALKQPLPESLAGAARAWVACIAGAVPVGETRAGLERAGFGEIAVIDTAADLNVYKGEGGADMCCAPAATEASSCCAPAPKTADSGCCGAGPGAIADAAPSFHDGVSDFFRDVDLNAYAASVKIFAVEPR